jgi:hypothetical protein
MLFGSASDVLASIIRDGRGVHDAADLAAIKAEGQRWKPSGYDAYQVELRHQYEGQIEAQLRAFAKDRFRHTGERMPMVPLNWARLFAENGAAVYDYAPSRYLERDGERLEGDELGADQERAADFADMVAEAQLEVVMAEAERRVTLARTMFLRVHSDSVEAKATGKPPRTKVQLFWPSDVLVIPHPRCPTSLATACALMARVSGEGGVNGGCFAWELWTRGYTEDEMGDVVAFGPWRCELISEKTAMVRGQPETAVKSRRVMWRTPDGAVAEECPTRLPWIEWHNGVADGCPFLDADRNLGTLFKTVNAGLMSEAFAVDMNAAAILYRKSQSPSPGTIVLGPGAMPTVPLEDTIESLPMGADFAGIRASNNALVGMTALTNRQSASDYDAQQTTAPSSGVALKIKNEPQNKARLEAIARAREVESRLLPLMVEVHDLYRGTTIADDGITYRMEPVDPPEYEDAEVRQRRAIDARDAGLIGDVECRVICGYSRTPEDARDALERIREEKAKRAPSPMRLQLAKVAAGEPIDDTDDDQEPPGRNSVA